VTSFSEELSVKATSPGHGPARPGLQPRGWPWNYVNIATNVRVSVKWHICNFVDENCYCNKFVAILSAIYSFTTLAVFMQLLNDIPCDHSSTALFTKQNTSSSTVVNKLQRRVCPRYISLTTAVADGDVANLLDAGPGLLASALKR